MINDKGNRALIAAIISKAIEDGRQCKYPKQPNIAVKKNRQLAKKIKILYELICSVHRLRKIYQEHKLYLLQALLKYIQKLDKKRKDIWKELQAYEARSFLDHKNKLFCYYCTLIDIDPEYFSIKASKYFRAYDARIII